MSRDIYAPNKELLQKNHLICFYYTWFTKFLSDWGSKHLKITCDICEKNSPAIIPPTFFLWCNFICWCHISHCIFLLQTHLMYTITLYNYSRSQYSMETTNTKNWCEKSTIQTTCAVYSEYETFKRLATWSRHVLYDCVHFDNTTQQSPW
jgi:hypothetical protein